MLLEGLYAKRLPVTRCRAEILCTSCCRQEDSTVLLAACLCREAFQQLSSLLFVQIKRRASEALPELLRPVTPITNFEGTRPQDPSGIFGLVSNLEQLDVDDWEF